ncbi:MAG TPA: ABC transporter permease, partial [Burkholderiales bacterium]|nr:ABC transporter permease [Burkholderiales bacterium]
VLVAALAVAAAGASIEIGILRRLYKAPELLQLLATFALVLIVRDFVLWAWGPEDMLGPRAPGFRDAVSMAGAPFPRYDLLLIALGPLVFALLHALLTRTRWGTLVRAATEDREMAAALGVNQRWLFTGVFALGALLAGAGGALAVPREPASLGVDLVAISDAFVVVVVGGLGSIPGAFLAALLIGEVKAFCIGFGYSEVTLAAEFIVMAVVLVLRPWGLLGKPLPAYRGAQAAEPPLGRLGRKATLALACLVALLAALPLTGDEYTLVLATDILVFALFAVSLHFIMGPGGLASFGHAAYFGLGAYGAALLLLRAHAPMLAALALAPLLAFAGAALCGWFAVRLAGVYLAMLTLAFAQIAWSIAWQWDSVTGGSNGLIGVWPPPWLAPKAVYYYLALLVCAAGILLLWRALAAPLGYTLRAARDTPLRADAIGIDVRRTQWIAFAIAGTSAGVAGALYAFSKGSISPETLSVPRSVDALVMVLLGGVQTLTGPAWGAALFVWLQDALAREVEYWRAAIGAIVLALVLVFPRGITGYLKERFAS